MEWIKTSELLPIEYEIVETKIDDGKYCRNKQKLYRIGRLWFLDDKKMHVYYTPTHWRKII